MDDRENRPTEDLGTTSSTPSRRIGRYKLLQEIGAGGMGAVWMAEQEQPVRRRVAVKLIRGDIIDRQVVARFEAERQVLAMMDHPNIARVLDAGETDDGTPYFVMELVQGIPITDYCDRNRLTVSERLALFSDVCQAIQHAHQKAIIHRDLKPSNVLVCIYDGQAVPKVIDFGLAKALRHESRLTDKTVFTEFGQVVGTLQYMSPEQATLDALDIDTRTDIYSLGVLLYELLAGSPPIDAETLKNHALLKVLELIRDQEPPRPSQRLGESDELLQTVSAERRIAPVELQRALRGDLDWIVMKTLEKDRTRRYGSASQLADDVGRFLQGEAIDARPPSVLYRARKFVSRNRGSVAATAALASVLLLGVIGTSVGLMRAKQANEQLTSALAEVTAERDRADEEVAWSFRVASGLANVFQTDTQKLEFADEWSARLASLREEVGPTHESVVRQRALHAVWGWTSVWAELGAAGRLGADEQNMIYDRLKRWGPLVEEAYHAARGVLPVSDPLWTGLLNDQIQWVLMRRGEAPSLQRALGYSEDPTAAKYAQVAPLYEELIESMAAIHGESSDMAMQMNAEAIGAYQRANQPKKAAAAMRRYLRVRQGGGKATPLLDARHESVIDAFDATPAADEEAYARFLWLYYLDAATVFREGTSGRKVAYDQLIRWLASHDATPINADLADADLHHFITFCRDNRLHKHAVTASRALRDRMHARSDSPIEALRDLNRLYAGCLRGAEMYDEAEATLRESIAESDGATPSQDDWDRIGLARVATAREETEAAQDLLREVIDRCDASGRALTPVAERAMNELSDLVGADNEPDEYDRLNALAWEAWNAQVGTASNLDFESGYPGGPAAAWPRVDSWTQVANWHVVSDQQPFEGRYCGKLITLAGRPLDTEPRWFRSMGQYLDATKYRGKRIRYSAAIRVEGDGPYDDAQLWFRADRPDDARPHLFANMQDKPIKSGEWVRYQLEGRVDDDAEHLYIGVIAGGYATVYVDDARLEAIK